MFPFKCNIYVIILLNFLKFNQSLVEMPAITENEIIKSEAIIRCTFNKLFHNLKLKKIKEYTKLNEYPKVHKYFTSLALQDYETLNKIARLVKLNYKNTNKVTDFMEIINNLFPIDQYVEQSKNETTNNDESIITYIIYFLKVLQNLKEAYSVDKTYLNINTNILSILKHSKEKPVNVTSLFEFEETDMQCENDFWEPSGRRIFKGERTKITHFPFMASIQIFNNFYCAGSIIKSDLIITASSCLQLAWNNRLFRENPAFLSVRVGSSFYNSGGEVIPVLEIYFHPSYDPKKLRNNICVLRLSRHLNFRKKNKRIKKINFDRQYSTLAVTTPGITILGWGAREHSPVIGDPWKNILSFTVLDVYPLEDCQDVYSREYVTKKNFCAGFFSRGGGACNRDVGGPGISDGKLMGVISFGSPVCGTPDAPTVFTKLGYYSDWIEEIMEMDIPVSKKRTTLTPLFDPFTAPPSYTPSKPTTFKIPPLTGETLTPIPISLIDDQLRIFDENLFKDFLATMFHSKEIAEYRDEYNIELKTTEKYNIKYFEATSEKPKTVTFEDVVEARTKLIDASAEQSDVIYDKDTAYRSMEMDNQPISHDFDNEIEKLIGNVNLGKIIEEELKNEKIDIKDDDLLKNKSRLTLLHFSDDEKRTNVNTIPVDDIINERKEVDEGMSIPVNDFEDLTRVRENVTEVLPESELYGLLS